jgi:pyruvate,water dikinase
MWDLGRIAADTPAVALELERGVDGSLERLGPVPEARPFLDGLSRFLSDFGSRGPNEWESRSPTWETKPEMALAAIDRIRLADPAQSPAARHARRVTDREALSAMVLEQLSGAPLVQGQMRAALQSGRLFLAGRERTKTTIIKLVHEVRVAAMELGRRMVDRGALDEPQNIGMLQAEEFDDFLSHPRAWRDTVLERESRYAILQGLLPPFVINADVPPIETWEGRTSTAIPISPGSMLTGIPGCPGEATGRARIVLDAADPKGFQPGDVLVAPITDPSWTPLFLPASAVVVDVGSQLSHAIIVSRELGIPCVVSVTDGTRRIPDGATVKVDGTASTVTVL